MESVHGFVSEEGSWLAEYEEVYYRFLYILFRGEIMIEGTMGATGCLRDVVYGYVRVSSVREGFERNLKQAFLPFVLNRFVLRGCSWHNIGLLCINNRKNRHFFVNLVLHNSIHVLFVFQKTHTRTSYFLLSEFSFL